MKKAYETPVLTAEEFDLVDVIAASTPDDPQSPTPEVDPRNSTFEGPEMEI
ncbi:MAG: hypothetical protein IJU96_08775 [Clostridia bacterium]|nr:hypothetical protein [Clostridia bacterium]